MSTLIRPERVTRDFTLQHHTGNTTRVNVVTLPADRRLEVWFLPPDAEEWWFGHAKPIPEGMAAVKAADLAAEYIKFQLSWEDYNKLIPPDEGEL